MPDIKPLPDDAEPIGVDQPATPIAPATPSSAAGSRATPTPGATESELGPKLLDAFDDDADFSKDPEVEAATKGGGRKRESKPATHDADDSFIKAGLGSAKLMGAIGGAFLLGATIASGLNGTRWLVSSVLTIYNGLLHTATGLGAVVLAATLARKPIGAWDLGAARMLAAVGAFLLIFNLNITLIGEGKWEESILAAGAYVGLIAITFRLSREVLATLVLSHFFLWLIIQLGSSLAVWSNANPAPSHAS